MLNISSVIVSAKPGSAELVIARLRGIKGVEVHGASAEGRIVATIETEGDQASSDTFTHISGTEDVLSASLIFHQTESHPEMDISVAASPSGEAKIDREV